MSKIKIPSVYTIIFFIIVVTAFFTWVIPSGKYVDGAYQSVPPNPQGIWNVLASMIEGFYSASDVIFWVLFIGGFLNVTMKTGAIDAAMSHILKRLKGREHLLVPILFLFFMTGGFVYGMGEETIAFYAVLMPILLRAGYDPVVTILIALCGSNVGILGSIMNPFSIGVSVAAINAVADNNPVVSHINLFDGTLTRLVLLVLCGGLMMFVTLRYAARVKKDYKNSIVADLRDEHRRTLLNSDEKDHVLPDFTPRRKIAFAIYVGTFVVLILGVVPWIKIPFTKGIAHFFEIAYNFFAQFKILGLTPSTDSHYLVRKAGSAMFGDWWFAQLAVLFLISSILIAIVTKMKEADFTENFVEGARSLLGVSMVIGVARGISVIMEDGYIRDTILNYGATHLVTFGKFGFVSLTYLFYLGFSALIASTSGLSQATMPIMGPLGDILHIGSHNVVTIYQSAQAVMNFVTPTSGIVMGGIMLTKTPYLRFVKFMLPYMVIMAIISIVVISLSASMGY